jgi:SSS family solute:Na+ symporter
MHLYLLLLLAYSATLVLAGFWLGREVRASTDFFVARRGLGAGLIFATVLAANIGAGSTVGASGLGYQRGLSAWWWNGSAGIGSLLLAFWIAPRIWRLAARHDFYTVGDLLERRYGGAVRGVIAVLLWLGSLSILAGQLIAVGWILNVVADVPRWIGSAVGGGVMIVYFTAGGLHGSARVNLIQLVVKLAGFAIAVPMLVSRSGGLHAIAAEPSLPANTFQFWGGDGSIGFLTLLVPAFMVSPGLLQKAYGAKDTRSLSRGLGVNAVALMLFGFVPALVGIVARAHYPDLSNPELALPVALVRDLPVWIGALSLAAVFSAEVSAADAILFMLATSLSQDLYRRFLRPDATDRQLLRMARVAAVAGGAGGLLLAIVLPGVIAALTIFYALLGVSLFVPIIVALHSEVRRPRAALASIIAGTLTFAVVFAATANRGWGAVTPNLCGILASALTFFLFSFTRRARPRSGVGAGISLGTGGTATDS